MKIDEIDKKILQELCKDGRKSFSDLSKIVGISKVAVRSRVKKLLRYGIIERFTVSLNREKLGYSISAFFEIETVQGMRTNVVEELKKYENGRVIYGMIGGHELHVHFIFKNYEDLEHFINDVLHRMPGIKSFKSSILLTTYKRDFTINF
ncbi:MAG: Lrp/AsnC family transcriptional regulator [Candidatus Bathyarchaeia archaeon]